MTDTAAALDGQATDTAPAADLDAAAAMQQLRDLFGTLVPPDRLELQDAMGNSYTARAVLPARAQILVMQQLHALWERPVELQVATGDAAGMAGLVVGLAADPVVLDSICEAFSVAHPQVVAQARKAAAADGLGSDHPADLFPVEELVAGLIPFFVRFAARAANLMGQVTSPTA